MGAEGVGSSMTSTFRFFETSTSSRIRPLRRPKHQPQTILTDVVGGGGRRGTGATTLTDLGVAGGAPALSKEKKKERGQVPHRSGDTARATPLGRHRSGETGPLRGSNDDPPPSFREKRKKTHETGVLGAEGVGSSMTSTFRKIETSTSSRIRPLRRPERQSQAFFPESSAEGHRYFPSADPCRPSGDARPSVC